MDTINVTLRMDRDLKESADKLFGDLGLSFSAAVNLFVRKAVRTQSIPFEVSMSTMTAADRERLKLFEDLLASPEALRRLSEIGEGAASSYDSLTSAAEAQVLIGSVKAN